MSNEPVAWVKTENFVDDDGLWSGRIVFNQHGDGMPLYTRPVDDTTLLRQALEALKQHIQLHDGDCICQDCAAITALRERLGEKT
jgi:hypothetical protein